MRHLLTVTLALAGFAAGPAASAQTTTPPTTPAETPVCTHQLKLGLRSTPYEGWMPSVAYEWQVAPRLTVEVGGSFIAGSSRGGWDSVDYSGDIIRTRYKSSHMSVGAFAQSRYYLQAGKAPLTGWYVALGLQSNYSYYRQTYSEGGSGGSFNSRVSLQPQLRLGRQWALGQRLSLDTYLGLDYQNGNGFNRPFQGRWRPATGLQLGYRF